jgi:hypothetical protein
MSLRVVPHSRTVWLLAIIMVHLPVLGQRAGVLSHTTPAYIGFSRPEFTVPQDQTNALITVVRTGEYRIPARVQYTTQDGTAIAGQEYSPAQGTLLFPAGVGFATFSVPLHAGTPGQSGLNLRLVLSSGEPDTKVTQGQATLSLMPAQPKGTSTSAGLKINNASGGKVVVVTWSSEFDHAILEESGDPAGHDWKAVAVPVQSSAGTCSITQPVRTGGVFFRLNVGSSPLAASN